MIALSAYYLTLSKNNNFFNQKWYPIITKSIVIKNIKIIIIKLSLYNIFSLNFNCEMKHCPFILSMKSLSSKIIIIFY